MLTAKWHKCFSYLITCKCAYKCTLTNTDSHNKTDSKSTANLQWWHHMHHCCQQLAVLNWFAWRDTTVSVSQRTSGLYETTAQSSPSTQIPRSNPAQKQCSQWNERALMVVHHMLLCTVYSCMSDFMFCIVYVIFNAAASWRINYNNRYMCNSYWIFNNEVKAQIWI